MLSEGDRCELYEPAQAGEEPARYRVLRELGPYALLPKPNPRVEPDESRIEDMIASRRPTLRQLATEAGLLKPNDPDAYQKEREELIPLLRTKFPGIEELDEDAVKDLLAEEKEKNEKGVKDDKPAKVEEAPAGRRGRGRAEEPAPEPPKEEARTGRRGRGAPVEEAPAPAPKEEPKAEPMAEGRRGRRGRGDAAAESPKAEPAEGVNSSVADSKPATESVDITPILTLIEHVLGEVKGIGVRLEKLEKLERLIGENAQELEILSGKIEDLDARLNEVHVGVESLYLNDIDEKDQSLADIVKRINPKG